MSFFICKNCKEQVNISINGRCINCNNNFISQAQKGIKKKYIVVGGCPIRTYTGAITFSSISKIAQFNNKIDAESCLSKNYERCGGLIEIFEINCS